MARLDFSGFGDLEEVCIGNWGQEVRVQGEIEGVVEYEMEGGSLRDSYLASGSASYMASWTEDLKAQPVLDNTRFWVEKKRSLQQTSSVSNLLFHSQPPLLHVSLDTLTIENPQASVLQTLTLTVHPHPSYRPHHPLDPTESQDFAMVTSFYLDQLSDMFPSSRFNLELVFDPLDEAGRSYCLMMMGDDGWVKDGAGWWTHEG